MCVAELLGDVWNNYFFNGAIWINTDSLSSKEQAQAIVNAGDNLDSALPDSMARGSLNNANVTMETFTQTFNSDISQINVASLVNCFTCHYGESFQGNKSPIYLSHIFDASIHSSNGKTRRQIDNLKDNQNKRQVLRKRR